MENLTKMDDLGLPPSLGNPDMCMNCKHIWSQTIPRKFYVTPKLFSPNQETIFCHDRANSKKKIYGCIQENASPQNQPKLQTTFFSMGLV